MTGFRNNGESARRARGALVALVALAAALGAAAAPAGASRSQESVFQDDRLLIFSDAPTRERTLEEISTLGADTVHTLVFWRSIAPAARNRRRPAGFDAGRPASYPPENWDPYDDLVRGANARGLSVIMSPSGRIPSWAARCGRSLSVREVCKPSPTEYGRFVEALARRYTGTYNDENQGGGVLPRVDRWSIWNEPNLGSWLRPQSIRRNGRTVPYAPHLYRRLVEAGVKALRATGHADSQILLGETAPLGRTTGSISTRPTAPLDFLREAFCLDARGRSFSGGAAQVRDCRRFRRLAVDGISHHPYNRGGAGSPRSRAKSSESTISSNSRLRRVLSQAASRKRISRRASRAIYFTEFGFQTNPPDDVFGISLARQAAYINEADFLAYRDSRVKSVAQYELSDEPNLDSFQTGLRLADGSAKPSLDAYRLPIFVVRRGARLYVYGQVRQAPDHSREQVEIQKGSAGVWETVKTVTVSSKKGQFYVRVPNDSGRWRLRWTPSKSGDAVLSREASAARR